MDDVEPLWGVWCERDGEPGFWRQITTGNTEFRRTLKTEAERLAKALNENQAERTDSLGWRYEARPFPKRDEVYSAEEREPMLAKMKAASDAFYRMAVHIGCHPFVEFCGLMNEYIKICQAAQKEDIDFTNANAHSGHALPMETFHVAYLAEKLECIYGPAIQQDPELRRVFLTKLGLITPILGADDYKEDLSNLD